MSMGLDNRRNWTEALVLKYLFRNRRSHDLVQGCRSTSNLLCDEQGGSVETVPKEEKGDAPNHTFFVVHLVHKTDA